MTAPTHSAFGMLLAAFIFSVFSVPLMRDPAGAGFVIIGSLLPDIDYRTSAIGRVLFFISGPIEKKWGHRTVTHSLLALLVLIVISLPLWYWSRFWWICLSLGYFSHLLIDSSNKAGTPLFWPSRSVCVFPYPDRLRISTGSVKGEGTVLVILIVLLGLYMPVSNLGLFRAIRYISASQRSAYADYRGASTQTMLKFKGIYANSRVPVEGMAPILEGSSSHFLIYYAGRPVVYGESGEIIPLRSRVLILNEPVSVRKVPVDHLPPAFLKEVSPSCLISGTLLASADFTCVSPAPSVRAEERELVLTYADSATLESISIYRKTDSSSMEVIKKDMAILEAEIQSLQSQLPENLHRRLSIQLATLESTRFSLLDQLASESDPIVRIRIREKLASNTRDRSRIESRVSSIDFSDQITSLKLKKAILELERQRLNLKGAASDSVLFTGELSFRTF